jgi:CDP-glycerol glycerophosphotransferase (TagB/SpsB family)
MYRRHLGEIPFRLKKMGYEVIVFSEDYVKDRYSEEFQVIAPIEDWMVGGLNNVDVFITTDMFTKLPKASERVHFPHGMFTFESFISTDLFNKDGNVNIPRFMEILDGFDHIACMRPSTIKLIECVSDFSGRQKTTSLIPCGYPSVDINLKDMPTNSTDRDSVLYAPAGKYIPGSSTFADYTSFPMYSAEIINELARIFEDKRIIFRPHPGSLIASADHIERIMRETAWSGRVVLDSSDNSQKDAMSRSVLTVTDHSSTGYNFALTQLRPVVFFQKGNPDATGYVGETAFTDAYFKFRNEVGVVVSSVQELRSGIEHAISKFDNKHIMNFRENFFFNLGKSEDYFIDNFESILAGKTPADWKMV